MRKILFSILLLCGVSCLAFAQSHDESAWTASGLTHYSVRYASNPIDVRHYDTQELRSQFLVDTVFSPGKVYMLYTFNDRMIIGGAMPLSKPLNLETIPAIKSKNFLEHREIGIINVGGTGKVKVDDSTYTLKYKEAIYIGRGSHNVVFESLNPKEPALFYFNSTTAHKAYPTKFIALKDAQVINAGSQEYCNKRVIRKIMVNGTVSTCQLQMGMTEMLPGNVWNTMPPHTHARRTEIYFYFRIPKNQAVLHLMGEPKENKTIWVHNNQAVIAAPWSIHAGVGTANYIFIWGMGGENLDYTDMHKYLQSDLK